MPKNFQNLRRLNNYLKVLGMTSSLTLGTFSCQTSGNGYTKPEAHEREVLESQKALVRNALDTGKPESALKSLRELLQIYPDDASLNNLMGLTQLALKNYGRAIRHFQESYKLDPQVATGLNLSSALIESGNYSGAEKLLKALSKEATKIKYRYKERIFHNLGYCAFKQKNTKRAEEWFKLSLEENPTFFPAHLELARLYDSSQRKALAIESYRQALDYCRTCLDPLEPLAKLYVSAGQGNEAKRLITQYLRNEDLTEIDRQKALALLSRIPNQAPNPGTLSRSLDSVSGVESIKQ